MKKLIISGIAAVALCCGMVGCSNHDDYSVEQAKKDSYAKAFEKEFGKVASDQNWGFVDQAVLGTRGENVNRNQWGSNKSSDGISGKLSIPVNVTEEERDLVYDYFNKKREGVKNTVNVNWTDFVVSQVWKGEDEAYDYNQYNWTETAGQEPVKGALKEDAQGFVASDKMNHLQCLKGEGSINAYGQLEGAWEHINDYNGADQWANWDNIKGHTYMLNSGTLDFAYHNTVDSKYHNDYIIIPGAEIDASLAGYYYIGFDFSAYDGYVDDSGILQKKNMCADRDWVFTDWIVRISPAEFIGSQRVFIEDLITNSDLNKIDPSDWDFNDAVFDVFIESFDEYNMEGNSAVITLRAAGGTLPLTIAGREVHELFGVGQQTMVNTGYGVEKAPVQFRITGNDVPSANAKDIKVYVTASNNQVIELTAEEGEPTQKLAAPIENHVKWLKERTHIKNGYPTFMEFVGNKELIWYEPAVDDYLFQKWYK